MEDREVGRARAHLHERDAELLLVLGEHGEGARERLEHELAHLVARALDRLAQIDRRRAADRDEIHLGLEARAAHADRIANPRVLVDAVLLRDRVQQLAILRDRLRARDLVRAIDVGRVISSPFTATMPVLVIACTCSPAMPAYTPSICAPAIRSASCIAFWIERVVSSMSETTPRRIPVVRACPTPSIFSEGALGKSPTASAMMAVVRTSRCRGRRRGVRDSLRPGDDLVAKAQIELGHARLSAREVRLDGKDVGEPLRGDARERSYLCSGKREYNVRTPHSPNVADFTEERRTHASDVREQMQERGVRFGEHRKIDRDPARVDGQKATILVDRTQASRGGDERDRQNSR